MRYLAVVSLTVVSLTLGLAMAAPPAKWTDRNEYDLVLNIRAEATAQKRLALLDQWKAKYPKTELLAARQELYFSAYQSLGDSAHMLAIAREMIASGADSMVGLYWCTLLTPEAKEITPDLLAGGEKAARQLLSGLDKFFAPGNKPAAATAETWTKQRGEVEVLAHRALGWIQWQRADYPGAEGAFTKCLELDPNNAEVSAWLGTVLALDRQQGNQASALWHLARAASLKDAGALPESQRRQLGGVLDRLYVAYHGESGGLDQLRAASAAAAFPPKDFAIESASAAALRKQDEELSRTNPQLASWIKMRRRLEAPDGEAYFATVRNTPLPMRLKGTLLRTTPPNKPKELAFGVGDATAEEVILKFEAPLSHGAEFGTVVEFEGVIDSFTRTPFSVTILAAPDKMDGWPSKGPTK